MPTVMRHTQDLKPAEQRSAQELIKAAADALADSVVHQSTSAAPAVRTAAVYKESRCNCLSSAFNFISTAATSGKFNAFPVLLPIVQVGGGWRIHRAIPIALSTQGKVDVRALNNNESRRRRCPGPR